MYPVNLKLCSKAKGNIMLVFNAKLERELIIYPESDGISHILSRQAGLLQMV